MKKLAKLGNSFAIPINKKTLQDALLDENAKFNIQIIPGGGLLIQSVEEIDRKKMNTDYKNINTKYRQLFKRLADS